jgi:hypothetical protein
MEHGEQPLNQVMLTHQLSNQDLVQASPDARTHKQVQKARKGRALTGRMQRKILKALYIAVPGFKGTLGDLFTYQGR